MKRPQLELDSESFQKTTNQRVWIIQHNPVFEKNGRYIWDKKDYQQILGNVKYLGYERDDVILKAIELFIEHYQQLKDDKSVKDDYEDDKTQVFELTSIQITPGSLVKEPEECFTYNNESLYEMIRHCSRIGDKAKQIRISLVAILQDWNSTKEKKEKNWFSLATFSQKLAENHPQDILSLVDNI